MQNKKLQPLVYALLIIAGILIGNINNSKNPNNNSENTKINGILNLIQDHYVDPLNIADFEDKTINAILSELDPHSAYISEKISKQ